MRQRTDPVPALSRVIINVERAAQLLAAAIEELHTYADQDGSRAARYAVGRLSSARFVTIELAALMTGFTPGAIRTKITKGVWVESRQYVKRDGRVLIDMKGYEAWAEMAMPERSP